MKKWTQHAQAVTPDGKTLSLHEHDGSYTIRIDGIELMSTRQHHSEERLAELACAHIRTDNRARVLIGGLGFGFTLKAALASTAPQAKIVVAELYTPVIAWNRNPTFNLAADALMDSRVSVVRRDVARIIRDSEGEFDSIILDVDNGPNALSAEANQQLYDLEGLLRTRAAMRPSSCAAFWSSTPDAPFEKRMAQAGFKVEVQRCRSRERAGSWHTIFLGRT